MSLLPEDNLLANVQHVDVALVIMRRRVRGLSPERPAG